MRPYSVIIFIVCINLAAFILHQSGAVVGSREAYFSPLDISNQFSLTMFFALLAGAGAIGVIGILFQQNIFAMGALLVWVIGGLTPIAQWFLLGTPYILAVFLPAELSWLSVVVSAFFAIVFFMFLVEVVGQRPIT